MRNIALTLAYDGKEYLGWQKTREGPSVESVLKKNLEKILQHSVTLQAASRTDAGVHAEGQIVNFLTPSLDLNLDKLVISLNQLLPSDIAVPKAAEMPLDFHPTVSAKGKCYHYYICNSYFQFPHHRRYSWHCHYPLSFPSMEEAISLLTGKQNFSSFRNGSSSQSQKGCAIREISAIQIEPLPEQRYRFAVYGHHFLYQMVRNLIGTLIYIGRGKIPLADLPSIITSQDRRRAGPSAPAHGLFLHRVYY